MPARHAQPLVPMIFQCDRTWLFLRCILSLFIVLGLLFTSSVVQAGSLVPEADWMSDQQARLLLARLLAKDNATLKQAEREYRRYLRSSPAEFLPQMELAEVLVRLNRFHEARNILEPLTFSAKASQAFWELLGDVRLYDGAPKSAVQAYQRAAKIAKPSLALRRKLALALSWSGDHKNAVPLLWAIYNTDPSDVQVALAVTQSLSAIGQSHQASKIISKLAASHPNDLEILLAKADVEAGLGHAVLAKQTYERAEQLDGSDRAVQAYAARAITWGDFHRTESMLRQRLANDSTNRKLLLELIDVLIGAQRYEEAEMLLQKLLRADAKDLKALSELARLHLAEKNVKAAQADAKRLARIAPSSRLGPRTAAKAYILSGDKKLAFDTFRQLCALDQVEVEDCQMTAQLGHSLGKEKEALQAEKLIKKIEQEAASGVPLIEEALASDRDPMKLTETGALLASQGLFESATDVLHRALEIDPDCFPASMALAEVFASIGNYKDSLDILDKLNNELPNTYKIMLTRARVFGWSKQYEQSLATYDELLRNNPNDTVAMRESARTSYWAKNAEQGAERYKRLEDTLTHVNTEKAESVVLEADVKAQGYNRRFGRALETATDVLDTDPGNQEVLFDQGQAACALGLCDRERSAYEQLLYLDPMHSLAQKALDRLILRNKPAVNFRFSYWDEDGKGGRLAQITRYRWDVEAEVPFADRYALRVTQHLWLEDPKAPSESTSSSSSSAMSAPARQYSGAYWAEGQSVFLAGRFSPWFAAEAAFTNKQYQDSGLSPVYLGRVALDGNIWDVVRLGLTYERLEELSNNISLAQSIQSDNLVVSLSAAFTRWLDMYFEGRVKEYSDGNQAIQSHLDLGVFLLDHPHELKLIFTGETRETLDTSRYVYEGDQLMNIIHPYWTPQHYRSGAMTLRWRHDLANDMFCGAKRHYYGVSGTVGTDTDNNEFWRIEAEYLYDVTDHISASVKGLLHRSQEWDAQGVWASLTYRF